MFHPVMSYDTVHHCAVHVSSDQSKPTDKLSEVINYLLDDSTNNHLDQVTYPGETKEPLKEKKD